MNILSTPLYFYSFLPITLGVGFFYMMQGSSNFAFVFLSSLLCVIGMNLSGILFYKSCKLKNEVYRCLFSTLHILGIIFLIISLNIL